MSVVINYIVPLVLFILLASPAAFKNVRNILGSWVASSDGLATPAGLAVHGIVFIVIVGFIMNRTYKKNSSIK
jgi:positive regulator of sigma E activity